MALGRGAEPAHRVTGDRMLDFEYFRAELSKDRSSVWPGEKCSDIDDPNSAERQVARILLRRVRIGRGWRVLGLWLRDRFVRTRAGLISCHGALPEMTCDSTVSGDGRRVCRRPRRKLAQPPAGAASLAADDADEKCLRTAAEAAPMISAERSPVPQRRAPVPSHEPVPHHLLRPGSRSGRRCLRPELLTRGEGMPRGRYPKRRASGSGTTRLRPATKPSHRGTNLAAGRRLWR